LTPFRLSFGASQRRSEMRREIGFYVAGAILCTLAAQVNAQSALSDSLPALVRELNQIAGASSALGTTADDVATIKGSVCRSVEIVVERKLMSELGTQFETVEKEGEQERNAILDDDQAFQEFLEVERGILKGAGASDKAVLIAERLLTDARASSDIRTNRPNFAEEQLITLQQTVCSSQEAESACGAAIVSGGLMTAVGLGTAFGNGAATFLTAGFSAASEWLGTGLIGAGLGRITERCVP
jgi:hypothetical protein